MNKVERSLGSVKAMLVTALFLGVYSAQPAIAQQGSDSANTTSGAVGDAQGGKDEKASEAEEEVVKTGVIASTGNYGFGPQSIESGATGAAPGDEASVIAAGVSRVSRDECQVTITNNSDENSYSVGYRFTERNNRGSKVNSKYFSDSLDAKESKSRKVACSDDTRMEVELRSAKRR